MTLARTERKGLFGIIVLEVPGMVGWLNCFWQSTMVLGVCDGGGTGTCWLLPFHSCSIRLQAYWVVPPTQNGLPHLCFLMSLVSGNALTDKNAPLITQCKGFCFVCFPFAVLGLNPGSFTCQASTLHLSCIPSPIKYFAVILRMDEDGE